MTQLTEEDLQNARSKVDQIRWERQSERTRVGVLDGKAKVRVTSESLGVWESQKCIEYYERLGTKPPPGTPSFKAMQHEWKKRKEKDLCRMYGRPDGRP